MQCSEEEFAAMTQSFAQVETYKDLLDRNLQYLSGDLQCNPYTHAPIHSSEGGEMLPLLGALQEATRLGYYSITGQPAREVLDEPVTLGEGDNRRTVYRSVQQRGYSSGWLPEDVARKLEAHLSSDAFKHKDDIYYRIDYDDKKSYEVRQNIPFTLPPSSKDKTPRERVPESGRFNLKRVLESASPGAYAESSALWAETVHVWDDVMHRRNVFYQYKSFPKVMSLFLECAGVYIVTRDYNSPVSVEAVVRDFLQAQEAHRQKSKKKKEAYRSKQRAKRAAGEAGGGGEEEGFDRLTL